MQGNIHLVHRTRPDATTGDRNPKALSIKGPMMGHSIGSNNHFSRRKSHGTWTLSQLRKPLELMQSRKRKVKRKKEISKKVINIKFVTLNYMAQPAQLCMAIGTKGSVAKKDITFQTITGCLHNKP